MQDCAREARQIFFSDEQNHRKIWTFSGIFKHILDKKWIFSRSLKKDIDQDMIFCTKRFFDRISRKYPSKFFDIISDLVPGKRIYIRDILSLDIYPYQVWVYQQFIGVHGKFLTRGGQKISVTLQHMYRIKFTTYGP